MSNEQTKYFKALTGIRAIAAYMVFIHHFNFFTPGTFIHGVANELHIGVTVFFVLSGFLIAFRYSEMKDFSFKKYMVNRIARIYPMYFLLTTLTFLVLINGPATSLRYEGGLYLMNITFIRGFFDAFKFSEIAQGWSLTVEETFYILAPLFFILIGKSKKFLFILPLICIAFGAAMVFAFRNVNLFGFFGSFEFLFNYTFFGRCIEFFSGIALAILYKRGITTKYKLFTYTGIVFIIACAVALNLIKGNEEFGIRLPMGKVINTVILPITGVCLLFWGLINERTIISRILGSKLFVILGKSSYIFYLIHVGVISQFVLRVTNISVMFLVINVISIVLCYGIEEPMNNFIRKKFTKNKVSVAEPQPVTVNN